jgi:hypothetical protein
MISLWSPVCLMSVAADANQSNRERREALCRSENSELLLRPVGDLKGTAPNLEASIRHIGVDAIEMAGIAQSSLATFSSSLSSSHEFSSYIYHTGAAGSLSRERKWGNDRAIVHLCLKLLPHPRVYHSVPYERRHDLCWFLQMSRRSVSFRPANMMKRGKR